MFECNFVTHMYNCTQHCAGTVHSTAQLRGENNIHLHSAHAPRRININTFQLLCAWLACSNMRHKPRCMLPCKKGIRY
jgi:hypothetical protein